jgi:hypothetical protein
MPETLSSRELDRRGSKDSNRLYLTSKLKVMIASSPRRPLESLNREVDLEVLKKYAMKLS